MVEAKRPSTRQVSAAQKRLISAALEGDHDAARHLLGEVARDVRGVVVRFLGSSHRDVDDGVQDALIALMQALPGYRFESSLPTYARRIALLRLLDNQKRQQAQKRTLDSHFGEDPELTASSAQQQIHTENNRLRPLIRRLLAGLPSEQAEAFASRHLLGYSVVDIAESINTSPNTVRSRLRLAKEALLEKVLHDPEFVTLKEAFL